MGGRLSAPALVAQAPTVRIRGTAYPVLLPKLRDPRLHLAGVIVTLQVLGQTAFDFDLSIAQILVALGTCAALEVSIAFRRQRVIMWPASALLTGNGVAFVLRVPGTEHGDWWSLNGWWIFAGTAAVVAPLQAPDRPSRQARLQSLELRARALLPAARAGAGRPARVLVGAALAVARRRARADRRRWPRDPLPAAAARDRRGVLAHVRRRCRGARRERPRDDRCLASRADRRLGALARARDLARDPRLPLLHDHRPPHDTVEPGGRARVRDRGRLPRGAADRALDERVLGQGRGARRAGARLRSPGAALRLLGQRAAGGRAGARPAAAAARERGRRGCGAGLIVLAGLPARPEAAVAAPASTGKVPAVSVTATPGFSRSERRGAERSRPRSSPRSTRRTTRFAHGTRRAPRRPRPVAGSPGSGRRSRMPGGGRSRLPRTSSTASGSGSSGARDRGRRRSSRPPPGAPGRRRTRAPRARDASAPSPVRWQGRSSSSPRTGASCSQGCVAHPETERRWRVARRSRSRTSPARSGSTSATLPSASGSRATRRR